MGNTTTQNGWFQVDGILDGEPVNYCVARNLRGAVAQCLRQRLIGRPCHVVDGSGRKVTRGAVRAAGIDTEKMTVNLRRELAAYGVAIN